MKQRRNQICTQKEYIYNYLQTGTNDLQCNNMYMRPKDGKTDKIQTGAQGSRLVTMTAGSELNRIASPRGDFRTWGRKN